MSHGTAKLHDGVHERSCQVNSQKPWKSVKYRLHARFMRAHTHTHPSSVKYLNF